MNGLKDSIVLISHWMGIAWLLLLTASCAGRKPVAPVYNPVGEPPPNSTPLNAPPPTVIPPPPITQNPLEPTPLPQGPQPEVKKIVERPHVALVLGGAGVASFATVGLLKRLHEEGVEIEFIVASGWPALFVLGYGFLRSTNDLEWFAMKLRDRDFSQGGSFELNGNYSGDRLSSDIVNAFQKSDISESRVPIILSEENIIPNEVFEKGDWKGPLVKALAAPGIFKSFPDGASRQWIDGLKAINVDEALRRGGKPIIAVTMYDDYFSYVRSNKGGKAGALSGLYVSHLKSTVKEEFGIAQLTSHIILSKPPTDFAAKRQAIRAGYQEGARLVHELRNLP